MFALIALIVFILALLNVHIGSVNLVVLGLCFLAAHFVFTWTPWTAWRNSA